MLIHERNDKIWEPMKSNCSKCSGLCCTALFFSKAELSFPLFSQEKEVHKQLIGTGKEQSQ